MTRPAAAARPAAPVVFEYVGPGAIAVVGPYTGARYKFGQAGARVTVHGADVPSLLGVSGLKPVR